MRYLIILLVASFSILSCGDELDCIEDDPIFRSIFIDLRDNDGNNLIKNGTFNSQDIIIRFNDIEIFNPVFDTVSGIEHFIVINVHGPEGHISYEIQLSTTRTDTLDLNVIDIAEDHPCMIPLYAVESATYNGIDQTLEAFMEDVLITVVLT